MRQWRMYNIEQAEERLAELRDLQTDHELALGEIESEIEDLEYEIEQANEEAYEYDDIEADDASQRAADMNATLRDIGGGW